MYIMLRSVFVVCDRLVVLIVVWWVACVLLVIVAFESGAGLAGCLWLHLRWIVGFLISCCVYCGCARVDFVCWFVMLVVFGLCFWFICGYSLWLFVLRICWLGCLCF